jgi:pyruvate kinase
MQDLAGPKIRTGELKDHAPVALRPGDSLRVVVGDLRGDREQISTTYELTRAVAPGSTLLLDDGHIQLRVDDVTGKEIRTTVIDGGTLGEHKGINVPGAVLPTSAVTAKDAEDLAFGLSKRVDYVALSFVQTAADLQQARDLLHRSGAGRTPLVAKLERPEAVDHIDDILAACDAIMVARGDLGLELPLERVPRVQKEVTRKARARAIPVIVATQVLESMRTEPRPYACRGE